MKHELIEAVRKSFVATSGKQQTVLVVGDVMLDRYLWGDVERISPEAPVPVVRLSAETERLGGAGNVAANLAGLGLRTLVVGRVGKDEEGQSLTGLLKEIGVDTEGLVETNEHPTICKTRIIGGHQQMLRVDRESRILRSETTELVLAARVADVIKNCGPAVVVLSDYAKGVLSEAVCRTAIESARERGIPVLVDPKGRDYMKYRGSTALTPNLHELSEVCGVAITDIDGMLSAGEKLAVDLGLDYLALTRSEAGISLLSVSQPHVHLPAKARQVFDVSGAGDTVIATLAAGLAAGLQPRRALELANVAAGIVVGKVGTIPVTREELLLDFERQEGEEQGQKICEMSSLLRRVAAWRQAGERIVFTNGCFDLLHAGHVIYLEKARNLGDRMVIALNSDRSVRRLKGPTRPVIHEDDRARVLAALEAVDAVVLFHGDTPIELIVAVRPDVLVKGDDYRKDQVVGGDEVEKWGGRVELVPVVPGRSSSKIIARIESDCEL